MKHLKSFLKILVIFLLVTQNSFAANPIPGIGIVVKKNNCLPNPCKSTCNHGGAIIFTTGTNGSFSAKLEIGEYELTFPQDQLQTSINSIVKSNFPQSSYQYDGSGVEMVLDNSQITVNAKATKGNMFAIDKQNSSITIKVPKDGATLSGKLGWNDDVLKKSEISCPDGFIMQNGECVPINNAGNQQARTEGKIKGKIIQSGDNGMISVSLNANGGTSSSTGVDNSLSFNPSLGIAIHWKNFGIGLDAGTFNTKPDFDFNAYSAPLQNLDFLTITNSKNDWTSTYFMLGPQYTIHLSPSQSNESGRHTPFHNKLTFTLALKGGLTINKAPKFSVTDNSTPPKSIASYSAPQDYKTNAFSLKPSIGFDYWVSENFALTANAQYLMQTGQKEFTTGYKDLTNVNLAPPISPDQFQKNISTAPRVMTNTKGPENFMSFGFGITYSFRKGWDGTVKGGNKTVENTNDETLRKGWDGSIKGKNIAEKGIQENGLKKNEIEYILTDAEVKAIAETLVTMRKGWDGSIKGNIAEKKGIKEKGLKKNEAKSENINLVTSTAQTLVNLARKGWDGSIKGNKVENATNEADVKSIAETLVNIRKGWDGSIKGNKVENKANEADVKTIAETLINLRKGWDGSIKGNIMENVGPEESGDNIESIHIKVTITTKVGFTDCGSPGYFFCIGVEVGALANDPNLGDSSLEKDQIISKTNVALVNDNIIKVTSTGVKSTISEKTMSEFANKTQKNKEFTLDKNVLNEICKALHLNTPIEPVIFRAEDQKYDVINTVNEGKEVQILEIFQKTNIKIDGKEYILSMLTTSGKS